MAPSSSGEGVYPIVSNGIIVERTMTDREQGQLLATATDRFERRLSDEVSKLRDGDSAVRLEIANLRVEMTEQFAASRIHTEARHHELLKWSLLFWVGQAATVAGIVSALT
jgi:predicted phage tail protein